TDAVAHATFNQDASLVASCSPCWGRSTNGYVFICDTKTGAISNRLETYGMDARRVWFSPGCESFWVGSENYLCEQYPLSSAVLREADSIGKVPSCWTVYEAVYSPDESRLLVVGSFGREHFPGARVFDARTLRPLSPALPPGTGSPLHGERTSALGRLTMNEGPVWTGAFSPDGHLVATGGA